MKLFRGDPFDHEQENRAFHYLCSKASTFLEEEAAIVGNVQGDGYQIDALVLRPHSITIVDFKEYGGSVRIFEDETWLIDGDVEVKGGGRDKNPFQQVRRYKLRLIERLKANGLLLPPNELAHITGVVMFTQPVNVDQSAMPPKASKWFRAAAQDDAMTFLHDVTSRSLNVSSNCIAAIVQNLGAKPFDLQPNVAWVPPAAVAYARQAGYESAMQDIDYADQSRWWAENGEWVRKQSEQLAWEQVHGTPMPEKP